MKGEVKILNVTDGAYKTYCNYIKGNKEDSRELCCLKLTRNVLSGVLVEKVGDHRIYGYGCLRIHLIGNTVTYIRNWQPEVEIDKELKTYWSMKLGLTKPSVTYRVKEFFKLGNEHRLANINGGI